MDNGVDILDTVVLNSIGSFENSEFQNNQQQEQSVSITIYTEKRNFRTPKEMRDLHGSVEGVIILDPPPPANKVFNLIYFCFVFHLKRIVFCQKIIFSLCQKD